MQGREEHAGARANAPLLMARHHSLSIQVVQHALEDEDAGSIREGAGSRPPHIYHPSTITSLARLVGPSGCEKSHDQSELQGSETGSHLAAAGSPRSSRSLHDARSPSFQSAPTSLCRFPFELLSLLRTAPSTLHPSTSTLHPPPLHQQLTRPARAFALAAPRQAAAQAEASCDEVEQACLSSLAVASAKANGSCEFGDSWRGEGGRRAR